MFALIWAILLLSVSGCTPVDSGHDSSVTRNPNWDINKSCIILSEATTPTEARLCVVLPFSFTSAGFVVKNITWHKSDKPKCNCDINENIQPKGQVSLLESDLSKWIHSIIISDFTKSDSGSYCFRATGSNKNECKIICKTTISLKDKHQNPTVLIQTEGQPTTLICTAPCLTTENPPAVTQKQNLTLTFSAEYNSTQVTCKVSSDGGKGTEETEDCNVTSTSTIAAPTQGQSLTEKNGSSNYTTDTRNCKSTEEDLFANLLCTIQELHGIIVFLTGFVMGTLLSTIIACLVINCMRKKQKRSRFLAENMELMIAQSTPELDVDPAGEHDGIHVQHVAEAGAESSGPSAPDGDMRPKEAEYSDLDFSLMKRRNPTEAEKTQDTAETEYAEIKKEATEVIPDNGEEDVEVLEGSEVVMMGEDEEAKQGMAAEEVGGDGVGPYSNVKEVMDEV